MTQIKKVGQPTKYTDDCPNKLLSFYGDYMETKRVPSIAAFANYMKVSREAVYQWGKAHPEFGEAMDRAKSMQLQWLIERGISNECNTAFAIFMLKNNFNWTDRVEQKTDVTVKSLENLVGSSFGEDED